MEKTIKTRGGCNHSIIVFIVFFILLSQDLYSQEVQQHKDTVYFEEEPVIINEYVTVEEVNYDYIELGLIGELYLSSVKPFRKTHTLNSCKNKAVFLNGFSVGIIQYLRINHFVVGLGGYIERYQDNVCYCNKTYTQDTIIKNVDGSMGKEVVDVLESMENIDKQNNFTYLSIPVRVGYTFDYRKFSFYFKTGMNISYLLSNTFYYVETGQDTARLTEISSNQFITPDYGLNAEIGIGYKITNNFSITLTPWYNYSLNYQYRTSSSEILMDKGGIRISALFLY